MVVWRYLFQILLFAFDIYHDFEYPSTGTAQGARFGTSTVQSTSPWSLDFGQTRLKQIISLEGAPFTRSAVCEGGSGSHEGRRCFSVALSKVHANKETFRPVLPHLSATLTSLLRSVVCSSAPEQASAARRSELCCELAEPRGIGTISNGTNGMANNPQDKEPSRLVKPRSAGWPRTRCTRSDWTTEYPQNMMMPAVGKGASFPQPPLPPPDTPWTAHMTWPRINLCSLCRNCKPTLCFTF